MAAYAALVSVMHVIDNLQLHSRPPISLHKEQVHLLTKKVSFLQEFLELYNPTLDYSKEADPLESRIARAAYAAEDAIESHIADHFTNNDAEKMISSDGLYEVLEKVIENMELIEIEAMVINTEIGAFWNQLHAKSTTAADSSSLTASSIAQKEISMVGADDLLLEMKSKLTADARDLQTIPIVGMGGSGKTTLAFNIYHDGLIKEHFDIRAWVTISQEYSIPEILIQLLTQLTNELNKELSEGELGVMLHKHLYGRKYMIILDDVWSLEAWDAVKRYLPNNKKGSRIVITTRLTTLASTLPNSNSLGMKLLGEDDSWDLLSKIVFGEKGYCPSGLEEIGKKIGKSCKGLPLSIVVVGGLLAKSKQTIQSWEYMEGNLNAIVNLEDDERCLRTLYMSYKQLPIRLKPCFLYMGIYREDHVIPITNLIKLWVAEGFLKPVSGRSLEDVARECLKDLIDRNLIMIHKLGKIGSIEECKVHDLLRDLSLREAQKQKFYIVYPGKEIGNGVSRIVMSGTISETEEIDPLSSAPLARSVIMDLDADQSLPPHILRLMRTLGSTIRFEQFIDNMHHLVNLRALSFHGRETEFPSLVWQFWNLQTLIVDEFGYNVITAPTDIWYMSHIRHLQFNGLYLPDPPPNVQDAIVLSNLHTLGCIKDFMCSEQVVKRIPNIKKLKISYLEEADDRFCLANLYSLDKLESLNCAFYKSMRLINFPQSLKKLTIEVHGPLCWQDILDKIGDLPLLEKLQLSYGTFRERKWETTEGQFCSLKFLCLFWCEDLQVWTSEASHFPRLEQLHLLMASGLEEIPSDFAEIPTLRLIDMNGCSDSSIKSAKRILEEQEALYGEEETTLEIQVQLTWYNNQELMTLGGRNFDVQTDDEYGT